MIEVSNDNLAFDYTTHSESLSECYEQYWEMGLNALKLEVDPQLFNAYLQPLRFSSYDKEKSEYQIIAPSPLICKHAIERFQKKISDILIKLSGEDVQNIKFFLAKKQNDNLNNNVVTVSFQNNKNSAKSTDESRAQEQKSLFSLLGDDSSDTLDSSNHLPLQEKENNVFEPDLSCEKNVFSPEEVWKKVIGELKGSLDSQIFAAYLEPLKYDSFKDDGLEFKVSAPSSLVCKHITEKFQSNILSLLKKYCNNSEIKVSFFVSNRSESAKKNTPFVVVKKYSNKETSEQAKAYASSSTIDPKYTFDNFIVGNSNQLCHAACMKVAETPGISYNPLFIYSGVGLGKTHLLHAIGNAILKNRPSAKVLYVSSEAFTNELIQCIRNKTMDQFQKKMRNIDVLLIDDIQFLKGKSSTQEEFFHTFNTLYSAKHQIVITSDKLPQEIPDLEERLKTRFSWGLTVDLQVPDFETRMAILYHKAAAEGFNLPPNVCALIAEHISSNIRELEGALTRLNAVSSLRRVPITEDLAYSALKDLIEPKHINLTIDDIKKGVCAYFNVKLSDLISKNRAKTIAFPRHVAMYLCRQHTPASYPEIGACFGGRDHTSAMHAINVISNKCKTEPETKNTIDEIEKTLMSVH